VPDAPDSPDTPDDEAPEEHRPDGLDLARSMMKGAAGMSTTPARRRPRRNPDGTARPRSRPGDAQLSGAHPDARDPQWLGSELGRIIDDRGWSLDLQVRGVFARWTEIVGAEIGAHSTPESLTDGTLVVRTDSTAWATQLKLFAGTVVRRLNEELGAGTVSVVEVLGPNAPTWKHGRRSARDGRGPRDTYG
jgi:predicted nucleic acid-binding Zn ribbon protein